MSFRFRSFDPHEPVRVYFTDLPHWRQEGCTYFVTYRLADSIPNQVLADWDVEKATWLRAHGVQIANETEWKAAFQSLPPDDRRSFLKHFNRQLNEYLDEGRGSCALREQRCSGIIVDGWEHFDGEQYKLADLVVMPNHVHLMLTPLPGFELEKILRSRKRRAARQINSLLGRSGKLWQKHSYDHIVRNETELLAFQQYIADNPRKANLRPGEYSFRECESGPEPRPQP